MPVLLAPEHWPAWLGETVTSETELSAMLRPYPGAAMSAWAVDRRVGNVRNDDPDLLTPLSEPNACGGVTDGTWGDANRRSEAVQERPDGSCFRCRWSISSSACRKQGLSAVCVS